MALALETTEVRGLGPRLRAARLARALTLRAAAEQLQISHNQLKLWELSVSYPDPRRLERIRRWIGVDAATLLLELDEELTGAFAQLAA
jgi:transcriptional regulator with XRE-family HTH domain